MTVTDDDGGAGVDVVMVNVANLAPTVSFDVSGAISFPGGDYQIVEAGSALPSSATGSDPGSDDLTFTWSVGDVNVYFNDGIGPDPLPSPFGTFPFEAADSIDAVYAAPGVEALSVILSDDDGGSDSDGGNVIVTGRRDHDGGLGLVEASVLGQRFTAHRRSRRRRVPRDRQRGVERVFRAGAWQPRLAMCTRFSRRPGGDRRAQAIAELMIAWLQFASGAVEHDNTVPLGGHDTIPFLELMFQAEATISNPAASDADLHAVTQRLARVRHAHE